MYACVYSIALVIVSRIAIETHSLAVLLWIIPASIPSFIGSLFLNPYQEAAWAAFYRDISGTTVAPNTALPESSDAWEENSNGAI